MAQVSEQIKVYIVEGFGGRYYWTHDPSESSPEYYTCLGSVEVLVEYDEEDLIDPNAAKLAQAEAALEKARADFAQKEQALTDRVQSLRALPHLEQ